MPGGENDFDVVQFCKDFVKSPLKVGSAIVIAVLGFLTIGFGHAIGEAALYTGSEAISAACSGLGLEWCGETPSIEESWPLVFSTKVAHCEIGKIVNQFRGWSPTPQWANGADHLVVCTDADQSVPRKDMPEELQKLLPECLTVTRNDGKLTVATRLDSGSICRAPYYFEGRKLIQANLVKGWFVCTPGHVFKAGSQEFTIGGVNVPECDQNILREYGFLP